MLTPFAAAAAGCLVGNVLLAGGAALWPWRQHTRYGPKGQSRGCGTLQLCCRGALFELSGCLHLFIVSRVECALLLVSLLGVWMGMLQIPRICILLCARRVVALDRPRIRKQSLLHALDCTPVVCGTRIGTSRLAAMQGGHRCPVPSGCVPLPALLYVLPFQRGIVTTLHCTLCCNKDTCLQDLVLHSSPVSQRSHSLGQ